MKLPRNQWQWLQGMDEGEIINKQHITGQMITAATILTKSNIKMCRMPLTLTEMIINMVGRGSKLIIDGERKDAKRR